MHKFKAKILLADSKLIIEAKLRDILTAPGEVEIVPFESSRQAIRILEADQHIDLVIAGPEDIQATETDLLNYIKTSGRLSWIPVMVLGDAMDDGFVMHCLDGGVSDIISTPILKDAFLARVHVAISNGRRRVLVVDDDVAILKVLRNFLELERYVVLTAESAEEALEILNEQKIHAVVTDMILQKMNGLELLVKIKEKWPKIPVVIITGHSGDFTPQDAIAAGADGYFAKPFKNMELIYTFRRIFGLRFLQKTRSPMGSSIQ